MRIAICVNEHFDASSIKHFALRHYEEKKLHMDAIDIYQSGNKLLQSLSDSLYDIVFMDVYLSDSSENGLSISRELVRVDPDCLLIFATESRNHAVEAFQLNAVHYLAKPLDFRMVSAALSRCDGIISKRSDYIVLKSGRKIKKIYLKNIFYIEVYDNTSVIHLVDETVKFRAALNEIEAKISALPAGISFLRCHRCYLINMDYVSYVTETSFVLENGCEVYIKKYRRRSVVKKYEDYIASVIYKTNQQALGRYTHKDTQNAR